MSTELPDYETILIVDDDFDTQDMLAHLLQAHGYRTLTAADREEALDLMSRNDVKIILLDYMMPGMSAVKFLDSASTICPKARVILTTAATRVEMVSKMLGIREFIGKPMDEQHLLAVLQHGSSK